MNEIVVLLGSNIEKEKHIPEAVRLLRQMCRVTAVSPVYETIPVGLLNQPNFFNTAVRLETNLGATQFKEQVLNKVERQLKRVRYAMEKNAPRTIDVDIVLCNDDIFTYGSHRVPDPDLLKWAHVAVPVADLVGDMLHPETGEPIAEIARRLVEKATVDGRPPLWPRPDIRLETINSQQSTDND
ncbi:MAG: 2-amino-4-hydroxy-6-hydroxymethyldihydropteridine diphosphokinase [Anaerolineae bacterium]